MVFSEKKSQNLYYTHTNCVNLSRSSALPTWQAKPVADLNPSSCNCLTARSTFVCLRLLTMTVAPLCARRCAIENPILNQKEKT